jgi:hypothetical protein
MCYGKKVRLTNGPTLVGFKMCNFCVIGDKLIDMRVMWQLDLFYFLKHFKRNFLVNHTQLFNGELNLKKIMGVKKPCY